MIGVKHTLILWALICYQPPCALTQQDLLSPGGTLGFNKNTPKCSTIHSTMSPECVIFIIMTLNPRGYCIRLKSFDPSRWLLPWQQLTLSHFSANEYSLHEASTKSYPTYALHGIFSPLIEIQTSSMNSQRPESQSHDEVRCLGLTFSHIMKVLDTLTLLIGDKQYRLSIFYYMGAASKNQSITVR